MLVIRCIFFVVFLVHISERIEASIPTPSLQKGTNPDERWSSYCDPQLGCLSLTSKWFDVIHRPVNLQPWPRDKIMTKFALHTREAPNTVYLYANDTSSITSSTFKASRPTKILTHGFMNTGYGALNQNITRNLLINGDYNVIVTHWGPGSGSTATDFFQAVANTRVVGLEIAYLVNTTKKLGVSAKDVHLIGHSLGAHVSGYAGQNIANLGRITGLDPAGPFFSGMDPIVRLDPSDAEFVDNLHTAAGVFGGNLGPGTMQAMGHVDIYANGGRIQPGCSNDTSSLPFYELPIAVWETLLCSHDRAREIFRDSLVSTCQAVAYECADYDTFREGNCYSCGRDNTRCAPVGLKTDLYPSRSRTNVKMYYATSNTAPFCQYQYVIQTSVANLIASAPETVYGALSFSISGTLSSSFLDQKNKITTFKQGQKKNLLMRNARDLGKINSLTLFWTSTSNLLNNIYCFFENCSLYVANVTISSLNHYPESTRLANTFNGCPTSSSAKYTVIASKSSATFNTINGPLSCN